MNSADKTITIEKLELPHSQLQMLVNIVQDRIKGASATEFDAFVDLYKNLKAILVEADAPSSD